MLEVPTIAMNSSENILSPLVSAIARITELLEQINPSAITTLATHLHYLPIHEPTIPATLAEVLLLPRHTIEEAEFAGNGRNERAAMNVAPYIT